MNTLTNEEKEILTVENQYWVDKAQALARLEENKDFQSVILEGYFRDKAVDGVSLLANDGIKQGGHRSDVMEDLIAISSLQDFFITIRNLGYAAEDDLDEVND